MATSWLVCSSSNQTVWGHYMVFLRKTLYSHSATLYPGEEMGVSRLLGITLQWTRIPSRGGVEIIIVALCYRKWDTVSFGLMDPLACMHTLPLQVQ